MKKKVEIKVALMLDSIYVEKWKERCITEITSLKEVSICLVILNKSHKPLKKNFAKKVSNVPFRKLLWRVYIKYFHKSKEKELVNIENKLKGIPILNCLTEKRGKYSEYFNDDDITTIKSYQPDVVVRFGFGIIRGSILNVATHGVWSYHHGDEMKYRGGPPGFWEIYKNDHVSAAILQRLTEELDAGIVLKKVHLKTIYKSYTDNLDGILHHSSLLIKQQLIDLINGIPLPEKNSATNAKIRTFPVNYQMLKYLLRKSYKVVSFHYRELFMAEKWNIGIAQGNLSSLLSDGIGDTKWLKELPRGEYRADPFTYTFNDHLCIIHEKYSYKDSKGSIEVQRSNEESNTAIYSNKHLSYPSVIEYKKDFYCIPESFERNRVDLYKLNKANNKWEFKQTILDGKPIVDPTIVYKDKKWWLFCTHENDEPNAKLYLYFAEELTGPYKSHTNNPIKSDVRSSRPAGNITFQNEDLIRPSQDCSKTYGSAVVLNKITKLSETQFEEEEIMRIKPSKSWKYRKGIHTINLSEKHIVFDAKRYEFNISNFQSKFRKKLNK